MDRIEDMTGFTPALARAVKDGSVMARAMVYENAPNGLGAFLADMSAAEARPVEGRHFLVNPAITDWLRPYTGEVWLLRADAAVLREVAPLLVERDSHPAMFGKAIHCYNNPLFRLVVGLGAWERRARAFPSRPAVPDHSPELEVALAEARARLALRPPEDEADLADDRTARLLDRAERARAIMEHEGFVANGLRAAGFRASASEHTAKASAARQRLRVAEAELKNHRVGVAAFAAALSRRAVESALDGVPAIG
jgi:hypothetical protein